MEARIDQCGVIKWCLLSDIKEEQVRSALHGETIYNKE